MNSAPERAPARLRQLIGQGVGAIDTPALVIDLDAMERNLQRMADYARAHGVRLRPHAKMHKSAALSLRQMQAGAVGLCVQKTSEAEALAAAGVTDLYISNEIIAPHKLQRVAALARSLQARGGRLAIAVDSLLGIDHLAHAMGVGEHLIDVFIELDVGQKRCGVAEPADVLPLAQAIARHPALRLAGLHDHRWLLPASALAGGSFVVLADTLARTAWAPQQLPVGVFTALIGVPVLLLLLSRQR
jgi:D-serine deaminase-like pyridoxal phosphate-dependent protein